MTDFRDIVDAHNVTAEGIGVLVEVLTQDLREGVVTDQNSLVLCFAAGIMTASEAGDEPVINACLAATEVVYIGIEAGADFDTLLGGVGLLALEVVKRDAERGEPGAQEALDAYGYGA